MSERKVAKEGRQRRAPILFAIVAPFQIFFRLEAAGGLVMIANAALALLWANSPLRSAYDVLFHAPVQLKLAGRGIDWTVHHFTNDALMTLFFVVAGLEIKRQIVLGELRTWRQAALPAIAAIGGMIVPALIYLAWNPGGVARAGWGIPMATDIAFALGCLSLVRRRVPPSVFVFLTALAIFDDLGAIVVIAVFYGARVDAAFAAASGLLCLALVLLGRQRVQSIWPYAGLGVLLWISVLGSGIHPTIAGVIVGFSLPAAPRRAARDVLDDLDVATTSLRRDTERRGVAPEGTIAAIERHLESVQSLLNRTMHALHGLVAFGIVPLFALANAGVSLSATGAWGSAVTMGTLTGLSIGKPVGILGATWLATRLGLASRPARASWAHLVATSLMGGIGFTMSLLIGNLAFGQARALEDQAKLGVLAASVVSAAAGIGVLLVFCPKESVAPGDDMPVVLDVPRFAHGYGVRTCAVSGPLLGRTLRDLDVRRRFGVTVMGVWRATSTANARNLEPLGADEPVREGEVLLVVGSDEAVDAFLRFAHDSAWRS